MSPRWPRAPACVVLLFMAPTQSAAAPPSPITGSFYKGNVDFGSPIPGALVAVYKAEGGELVNSTYSTSDGRFTLPGVGAPAKLFIVATKGDTSRRLDVDYDPSKPVSPLTISVPWRTVIVQYAMVKLDFIVGLAIGFVVALITRRYQDWRLFRRQIAALRRIRNRILVARNGLTRIREDAVAPGLSNERKEKLQAEHEKHFQEIIDMAAAWEKSGVDVDVVYSSRGGRGLDDLDALQQTIRSIKQVCEKIHKEKVPVGRMPKDERNRLFEHFGDLEKCKLLR